MAWNGNNFGGASWFASNWFAHGAVVVFPTQYPGLRAFWGGVVHNLCLVAVGDAPLGGRLVVRKNGTDYAAYLVDPADPAASPIRVQTSGGTKSVRLLT